jgi:chorismate dehydratase
METFLTVGRIPFLVCAPFFHRFLDNPPNKVRFLDGFPSEQNKRLRDGSIMLSPSSSIEYAKNPGSYVICNRFCTASTLEIRSVKLFSKCKWESLGGKSVYITKQSDASASLMKLISSLRFKVRPVWEERESEEKSCEAKLLIGDSALLEGAKNEWEYSYDLASIWQEWQGLPFVFGIWIIRKEALSGGLANTLNDYLNETETSLREFKENRMQALQKWKQHFHNNLPENLVYDYYNAVDYRFGSEHEESLKLFFKLCGMPAELKFI